MNKILSNLLKIKNMKVKKRKLNCLNMYVRKKIYLQKVILGRNKGIEGFCTFCTLQTFAFRRQSAKRQRSTKILLHYYITLQKERGEVGQASRCYAKTTRQRVNETTSGAVAGLQSCGLVVCEAIAELKILLHYYITF